MWLQQQEGSFSRKNTSSEDGSARPSCESFSKVRWHREGSFLRLVRGRAAIVNVGNVKDLRKFQHLKPFSQPKCPRTGEWVKRVWLVDTVGSGGAHCTLIFLPAAIHGVLVWHVVNPMTSDGYPHNTVNISPWFQGYFAYISHSFDYYLDS